MKQKLESLLGYLKQGDVKSPLAWSLSELERDMKIHDLKTSPPLPTWITNVPQSKLYDIRFDTANIKYFTSLPIVDSEERVDLAPPENFDHIHFSVFDVSDEIEIEIEYETPTGKKNNKFVRFKDGRFNESSSIPFSISLEKPATSATIFLESEAEDSVVRTWLQSSNTSRKVSTKPRLTLPFVNSVENNGFPIFLISIDTFRYDFLDTFTPVTEELGSDAIVPKEPRTQGHWTRPSHASTLTGVHPAEHGYVAGAGDDVKINRINENLTTLAEFLSERMYQCSGCVSQSSLSGSYGFAQGFHRYKLCNMSWGMRENDAKQVVNKGLEWISDDADTGSERIFHFLHFFDPHYPYIPPYPIRDQTEIDINLPNRYKNRRVGKDYLETVRNSPPEVPLEEQQTILDYYTQSLQFTARQVQRYIKELKNSNLYKKAFIAILGDHGEGFYDRKFATHSTLYDENIRPGCILKLPAMVDFSVPDEIDYIDLLPTVARMLNEKPPGQYSGQAWQSSSSCSSPRITERIRPDSYSVAVEINGKKGIFTYPSEFPELPKSSVISNGPIETEFYDLSSIRKNRTNEYNDLSAAVKSKLLNKAKNFASRDVSINIEMASVQPSKATEKRLEKLGYK